MGGICPKIQFSPSSRCYRPRPIWCTPCPDIVGRYWGLVQLGMPSSPSFHVCQQAMLLSPAQLLHVGKYLGLTQTFPLVSPLYTTLSQLLHLSESTVVWSLEVP